MLILYKNTQVICKHKKYAVLLQRIFCISYCTSVNFWAGKTAVNTQAFYKGCILHIIDYT